MVTAHERSPPVAMVRRAVTTGATQSEGRPAAWPTVTVVFLVYDRREELRTSLVKMLHESDYEPDLVDVIVVDNASTDGAGEMVASDFPHVRLVRRDVNCGVSGFNDGFDIARGEYVLALDDDCYLPPDGLRRAVDAARAHDADLVSFGVVSGRDPEFRFDHFYPTGLLTFWGCAVLMRRDVLTILGGYDPEIFVWANELEFTMRFYDHGMRHLHLPEVAAVHLKPGIGAAGAYFRSWEHQMNARHFSYIAAKLLWPRDAGTVFVALLSMMLKDVIRVDRAAARGLPVAVRGFLHGLRHRSRLERTEVSRVYRRDFHDFATPWTFSRPPLQLVRALPTEWLRAARGLPPLERDLGRYHQYLESRRRFYPKGTATLQL